MGGAVEGRGGGGGGAVEWEGRWRGGAVTRRGSGGEQVVKGDEQRVIMPVVALGLGHCYS